MRFFDGNVRIEICDGLIEFRATNGEQNEEGLKKIEQFAEEIKAKKILAELYTGTYHGARRIDTVVLKTHFERRSEEDGKHDSNERRGITPVSGLPRIGAVLNS